MTKKMYLVFVFFVVVVRLNDSQEERGYRGS